MNRAKANCANFTARRGNWLKKPSRRKQKRKANNRQKSQIVNHKSKMAFAHPYFLFLLLLLPFLAWLKGKRGSPPAFLYSSVKLVEGLTNVRRSRAGNFLTGLRWLTLAIFIFALAQPRLS